MRRFLSILFFVFVCLSVCSQTDKPSDRLYSMLFDEALRYRLSGDYDKAIDYYTKCLKLDDTSSPLYYELSRIFYSKRDFRNADRFADLVLKYDTTDNIYYLKNSADLKLTVGQYDKALEIFDKIIKICPKEYENYFVCSRVCAELKDYKRSFEYLDKIPVDEPYLKNVILVEKAEIYLKQGSNKKALAILNKLYKSEPTNYQYSKLLYKYYYDRGDFDKAIKYAQISSRQVDGESILFNIAEYYYLKTKNGTIDPLFFQYVDSAFSNVSIPPDVKYERFVHFLSSKDLNSYVMASTDTYVHSFFDRSFNSCISCSPDFEPFYSIYSNHLLLYKRVKEAIDVLAGFLHYYPGSADVWQSYITLLSSTGRLDEFAAEAASAYRSYPDDPVILLFYCESLNYQKKHSTSIPLLRKCLSIIAEGNSNTNTNYQVSVLNCLANSYYEVDSLPKSFECYDKVIALDPHNMLALNNYSYFLSLTGTNLDKAEQMSRKTIDIEPTNPTYLDTYAWILFKMQRSNEALFIIERAIDNGGDGVEIFDHYADILLSVGNVDKALQYWSKALECDPGNDSIKTKIDMYKK